jgi:hypothetical protein
MGGSTSRVWLIVAVRCGCLDFVIRIARAAFDILRLALARDHLGTEGVSTAPARRSPGILHILFVSREPLGLEPVPPRARASLLRTLFAPEKLPLDPEPAPAAQRRVSGLFAAEKLGDAPDDVP